MVGEGLPSRCGRLHGREWRPSLERLGDGDEARLLEHPKVSGEVAVREAKLVAEVGEGCRVDLGEDREDAEPCPLVDDVIEAIMTALKPPVQGIFNLAGPTAAPLSMAAADLAMVSGSSSR